MKLICRQCKENEILVVLGKRGIQKKLCDTCTDKNKNQWRQRKGVYDRSRREFPKIRNNLVKNYIYFMEGIRN